MEIAKNLGNDKNPTPQNTVKFSDPLLKTKAFMKTRGKLNYFLENLISDPKKDPMKPIFHGEFAFFG